MPASENEIRNCRFLTRRSQPMLMLAPIGKRATPRGWGKPVIYTCEKTVFDGKAASIAKPHFDTNHHLNYRLGRQRSAVKPADQLRETVRFTIPEARQAN